MKKFASLILTAVLLATMLTVFAVPASAKTTDEYMEEAKEYASNGQYEDAAKSYIAAAEAHIAEANWYEDADAAGNAYMNAGNAFNKAAEQYKSANNYVSAAETHMKAGECYEKANNFSAAVEAFCKAGARYIDVGDYAAIAYAYMKAGECFLKVGKFSDAAYYFSEAAEAARSKANESTGSTLSEGSLTIICTMAAAVIFGLGGFILGTKKKKKPALASGENTDEE